VLQPHVHLDARGGLGCCTGGRFCKHVRLQICERTRASRGCAQKHKRRLSPAQSKSYKKYCWLARGMIIVLFCSVSVKYFTSCFRSSSKHRMLATLPQR
jgi:hypothetical protein